MVDNLKRKRRQTTVARPYQITSTDLKLVREFSTGENSSASSEGGPGDGKRSGRGSSQTDSNASRGSGAPPKHAQPGSHRSEGKASDLGSNPNYSPAPLKQKRSGQKSLKTTPSHEGPSSTPHKQKPPSAQAQYGTNEKHTEANADYADSSY
jgi:hypothetical protein